MMPRSLLALALVAASSACQAQPAEEAQARRQALRPVPGCEGCEAAWERDPAALAASLTLAGAEEPGERLLVRGTAYRPDGRTPARGIVLYLYQTNIEGRYAGGSDESEWSRRHGRLRGWLKTGADGRYEIRTVKPGRYPSRTDPAHIHFTVLEAGRDPYWIDDVVFEGEPGVDDGYKSRVRSRGGSGIVRLQSAPDGTLLVERDIVLER